MQVLLVDLLVLGELLAAVEPGHGERAAAVARPNRVRMIDQTG